MPICSDSTMTPSSTVIPGGEHRGLLAEGGPAKARIVDPTTEDRTPDPELAASTARIPVSRDEGRTAPAGARVPVRKQQR